MTTVGYTWVSTGHSGVIATTETLTAAGVLLRSLREGIDHFTAMGKVLAGIFAALAGYERELMHKCAAAARAAARARGKHTGRPPRLSVDQMRQVRSLRQGGEAITDLASTFEVSRATIYRALQLAVDDQQEPLDDVDLERAG